VASPSTSAMRLVRRRMFVSCWSTFRWRP